MRHKHLYRNTHFFKNNENNTLLFEFLCPTDCIRIIAHMCKHHANNNYWKRSLPQMLIYEVPSNWFRKHAFKSGRTKAPPLKSNSGQPTDTQWTRDQIDDHPNYHHNNTSSSSSPCPSSASTSTLYHRQCVYFIKSVFVANKILANLSEGVIKQRRGTS